MSKPKLTLSHPIQPFLSTKKAKKAPYELGSEFLTLSQPFLSTKKAPYELGPEFLQPILFGTHNHGKVTVI